MNVNWKKTVTIVVDALLAVYLVLAFTAFGEPDAKAALCQKVQIDIQWLHHRLRHTQPTGRQPALSPQ